MLLQLDPISAETMITNLRSGWAIIVGFAILTFLQAYKMWTDSKTTTTQSLEQARRDITLTSIERYLKISADRFTEEVTDLQLQSIVNSFVGNAQGMINHEAGNIVLNNNVMDHQVVTKKKIQNIVFNRVNNVKIGLSRFKYHDRCMDTFMPDDFIDKTSENIITIVITERVTQKDYVDTYRQLESYIEARFEKLIQKIMQNAYEV